MLVPFCKVRNLGSFFNNKSGEPTPRVKFLMDLLNTLDIYYELDEFTANGISGYNLILPGKSKAVVAHHDIVNPNIDNANDNSASIINAIAIKLHRPDVTVALLDGEEVGGVGSSRFSNQINSGKYGPIDWVLNLELTGIGGNTFFIGYYPGKLYDSILKNFNCPVYHPPFNDSIVFRHNNIDSCVITTLPILEKGKSSIVWKDSYLAENLLTHCHSSKDTLDSINLDDMRKFVKDVALPIIDF